MNNNEALAKWLCVKLRDDDPEKYEDLTTSKIIIHNTRCYFDYDGRYLVIDYSVVTVWGEPLKFESLKTLMI